VKLIYVLIAFELFAYKLMDVNKITAKYPNLGTKLETLRPMIKESTERKIRV